MYFLARTYFYSICTVQTNKFIATVYLKLYCFILYSKLTRHVFWNPSSGSTFDMESRSWVRILFCPRRSTYSIFIVQYTNNIYNLNTILKIWFISIHFDLHLLIRQTIILFWRRFLENFLLKPLSKANHSTAQHLAISITKIRIKHLFPFCQFYFFLFPFPVPSLHPSPHRTEPTFN